MRCQKQDAPQAERILITAERLIRRNGFHKTTIADVATESRMSPANVHRLFGSKDEVRQAVCARLLDRHYRLATQLIQLPYPAGARIMIIVRHSRAMILRLIRKEPHLFALIVFAIRSDWEVLGDHLRRTTEALESAIKQGVASGEFRQQDAWQAASNLLWATAMLWHPLLVASERRRKPTTDSDMLIMLVLRGVGADLDPSYTKIPGKMPLFQDQPGSVVKILAQHEADDPPKRLP